MTPVAPPVADLDRLEAIARAAGRIALGFFREGSKTSAAVEWKDDGSPVTEADFAVDAFLKTELGRLWPGAVWLSEESVEDEARLAARTVVIVDPIDGTRGFARGDRHWAIAIALVEHGRPVTGIVHAPALDETYRAAAGLGATLNGVALRIGAAAPLGPGTRVTCSNMVAEALVRAGVRCDYRPKIASLALRIVKIASGVYDAGFVNKNAHDWDLAAADLILTEAGGLLAGFDGEPLRYNTPDLRHGVLIAAPPGLQNECWDALARASLSRRRQA